jgi:hypothetical protein
MRTILLSLAVVLALSAIAAPGVSAGGECAGSGGEVVVAVDHDCHDWAFGDCAVSVATEDGFICAHKVA